MEIGGGFGETVPGTDGKAVVAAVNAVADGCAKLFGDGAFVFDGEVGDAFAGIEMSVAGDCVGGAGVYAGGAFPTVIVHGRIGREVEGGDDFREEEPGAEFGMDLNGGFSIPAEAGFGGEVAFEDGSVVDVLFLVAAVGFEFGGEGFHLFLDDIVVVGVPGVSRELSRLAAGDGITLEIVEGENDDGLGAGEDDTGVFAAFGISFHPGHVAVAAVGDPLVEGGRVFGFGSGGDAAFVEAEFAGEFTDAVFEGVRHGDRVGESLGMGVGLGEEDAGALGNAMDDFVEVEIVGGDDEVGGFLVEGASLFEELGDGFAWVVGMEEGAFPVAGDAVEDGVFRRVEPDGEADFLEEAAIFGAEDDTAAGGDDVAGFFGEAGEGLGFDIAEVIFTVVGEDVGDGFSGLGDDEVVGIDEGEVEAGGEFLADGGFSGAHEADEGDVVVWGIGGHGV